MIGKLNHVAIAVPDLSMAMKLYEGTLGAIVGEPKDSSDDDHPRFSRGVRSGQAGSGRLF